MAVTSGQAPPSPPRPRSIRSIPNVALAARPSGEVSPAGTIPSAARTPSGSSPAPATTKVGGRDGAQGLEYENPYSTGSPGGSTSGATLVRATGFRPSTNRPHPSRMRAYPALNSAKPSKLNGHGDRSSIPQRAALDRPSEA